MNTIMNAEEFVSAYPQSKQALSQELLRNVIEYKMTKGDDEITSEFVCECAVYAEAILDNLSSQYDPELVVMYSNGNPIHFLAAITHNTTTCYMDVYGVYENITDIAERYEDIDCFVTVGYDQESPELTALRDATLAFIDNFDIEEEADKHEIHYTEFYDDFIATLFAKNIASICMANLNGITDIIEQ